MISGDQQKALQPVLVGGLLLAFGALLWMRLRPGPAAPPALNVPRPLATHSSAVRTEPAGGAVPSAETTTTSDTFAGRDPFQYPQALVNVWKASLERPKPADAPVSTAISMPALKVQGIFWGTAPRRAIVNDQILTEGDTIEGVQVITIDREGITVQFQGARSVLRLPKAGERSHTPSPTPTNRGYP